MASIVYNIEEEFYLLEAPLKKMTEGKFPFSSVTKIKVTSIKPILAPKYVLYPNTTEEEQILNAKKAYKL